VLAAKLNPGRDRSTGLADHYTDIGVDSSWLRNFGSDTLTVNARYTHEHRMLDATCALGIADESISAPSVAACSDGSFHELRADASYYWHNAIGVTVGAFQTGGKVNAALYPDSRTNRPDSSAIQLQLDGTPFGGTGSPFGRRLNVRMGVQYTAYRQFNGARTDYDGLGANASDNDTLRLFTWVAF